MRFASHALLAFIVLFHTSVLVEKANSGPERAAALNAAGFQNRLKVAGSSHILELGGEITDEGAYA